MRPVAGQKPTQVSLQSGPGRAVRCSAGGSGGHALVFSTLQQLDFEVAELSKVVHAVLEAQHACITAHKQGRSQVSNKGRQAPGRG